MAETPNPGPDPAASPDPTGATPPAPDPKGAGNGNPDNAPGGTQPEPPAGYKLVKEEDLNNLISQRDKNFDKSRQAGDQNDDLVATVADLQKQNFVGRWLKDNGDKYKDVTEEDLMAADTPDDVEAIAKRVQGRVDKIRQDALASVQKVDGPELSPEDRAAQLKDAEKTKNFDKFLDLSMPKGWGPRKS